MALDNLADVLARDDPRPARATPTVAIASATILSTIVVLAISIIWLTLRPEYSAELPSYDKAFAFKLLFAVTIVAIAFPTVRNLCVPGRKSGWGPILFVATFTLVAILVARKISNAPVSEWSHHAGATSWLECLWQIPALAAPAFLILTAAIRQLAPTNLASTGAFAGLLAGGIGAIGYALHCHDDFVIFVVLFYSLAILEVALIGALLGPRLFRWT